jgi:dTDP-4-dehydrorhamnose 3,5-epimerase
MDIISLALPDLKLIRVKRHGDERGWLAETWREDVMARAGLPPFVQDNQSFSALTGTVRGLHFQVPSMAQAKLVRAVAGRALDVVVDLRSSSPTFGRHLAVELDAQTCDQLFVPEGFAHGFCTLVPGTMLAYRVSGPYSPAHDRSLRWNDPALGIEWPVGEGNAILSDKDRKAPALADIGQPFP